MKLALALLCSLTASAADLVLRNGHIVTLDPSVPEAQAVAITAGRIIAVGTDAIIAREIQPSTKVIDLHGHLAIPGFIEGHGHFINVGEMKMKSEPARRQNLGPDCSDGRRRGARSQTRPMDRRHGMAPGKMGCEAVAQRQRLSGA